MVVSKRNNRYWAAFRPYERALYDALTQNNFSAEFAGVEDRARLAKDLSFLNERRTQEETVIALIRWINETFAEAEVLSVRATELLDAKSGACEVHAFAAGALESLGIKARWIGGAKTSIGFGYLEAFADGKWRLFKLRDPEMISMGKSAWELYRESEPSLNIRHFYRMPEHSVGSWRGPVYPALFMFANVELHPELIDLFTTDRGISVSDRGFNPEEYVFHWLPEADDAWVREATVMDELEREYRRHPWRRERLALDLGVVRFYTSEPKKGLPSPFQLRIVFP